MKRSRVVLSKRLQMLADMVTPGSRVADVGCDHGFLSIWLVQAGVSPRVLAMDVRRGPLAAAVENIEAYGMGDYIEARLSDGLGGCEAHEVETIVCAGMGGRLMGRILTEGMEKARCAKELILQPQSELLEFRAFLRREGFVTLKEGAVWEDGKYYFAMRVAPAADKPLPDQAEGIPASQEQRVSDRFGEKLLLEKNPVLRQYLQQRRAYLTQLADALEKGEGQSKRQRARLEEILLELSDVEYAQGQLE